MQHTAVKYMNLSEHNFDDWLSRPTTSKPRQEHEQDAAPRFGMVTDNTCLAFFRMGHRRAVNIKSTDRLLCPLFYKESKAYSTATTIRQPIEMLPPRCCLRLLYTKAPNLKTTEHRMQARQRMPNLLRFDSWIFRH